VKQEQKQASKQERASAEPEEQQTAVEKNEKLAEDTEDLLDEIDRVLEVNAEDFVKNYVQKGGELYIWQSSSTVSESQSSLFPDTP
jgi:prokaryotic ubiquitin-like protein Pup